MTHEQIERRVCFLTNYAVGITLVLVFVVLGAASPATIAWFERVCAGSVQADTIRTAVLEVERINVVQPDGKFSVVISNGDRIPRPIFEGDDFGPDVSSSRRGAAGLIFYNGDGTESGGLIHRTQRTPNGLEAGGILTFDQFEQDQVVLLGYTEDKDYRFAGLQVLDQSTSRTMKDVIDTSLGMQSSDPAVREAAVEADRIARQSGQTFGPQRILIGSVNRNAQVMMQDTRGRMRIELLVDSLDVARLTFYDASGKVVQQYPSE